MKFWDVEFKDGTKIQANDPGQFTVHGVILFAAIMGLAMKIPCFLPPGLRTKAGRQARPTFNHRPIKGKRMGLLLANESATSPAVIVGILIGCIALAIVGRRK